MIGDVENIVFLLSKNVDISFCGDMQCYIRHFIPKILSVYRIF